MHAHISLQAGPQRRHTEEEEEATIAVCLQSAPSTTTTHTCPWQSPAVAVRTCNLSAAAMHATCPHVRTEAIISTDDCQKGSSCAVDRVLHYKDERGRRAGYSCLLYLVRKASLFSCRYVSSFRGCRPGPGVASFQHLLISCCWHDMVGSPHQTATVLQLRPCSFLSDWWVGTISDRIASLIYINFD
jgi:hypothetical protein